MEPITVDFANFATGDDDARLKISQDLVKSLREYGTARLLNCGVPEQVSASYLDLAATFCALPLDVKRKIPIKAGPWPQRGYGAEGSEALSNLGPGDQENKSKPGEIQDVREHFDAGPPKDTQFPNLWPDETELPNFERQMTFYWNTFQEAAFQLLAAIELGLSLPSGTLRSLCKDPASELRFNRYPKVPLSVLAEGKKQRAAAHTDVGIISMLFQDDVSGLEIEDRANSTSGNRSFMPLPPGKTDGQRDVVLLVGDTLERWTNRDIKATVHRVSSRTSNGSEPDAECPERYSGAFFLKPSFDTSVAPLSQFVAEGVQSDFEDITYLAYHQQRMAKIYSVY